MNKKERSKVRKQLLRMAAGSKKVAWPQFVVFDPIAIEIVEREQLKSSAIS